MFFVEMKKIGVRRQPQAERNGARLRLQVLSDLLFKKTDAQVLRPMYYAAVVSLLKKQGKLLPTLVIPKMAHSYSYPPHSLPFAIKALSTTHSINVWLK